MEYFFISLVKKNKKPNGSYAGDYTIPGAVFRSTDFLSVKVIFHLTTLSKYRFLTQKNVACFWVL